jgi:hypothetical protein
MLTLHRPSLLFLCAIVACVGACSSSAPATSEAGNAATEAAAAPAARAALPHACDLLTNADAETVLGAGATLKRNSETSCYLETPNPLGPVVEVKIRELSDSWDGGEMMMKFDKEAHKVQGIGDDAYAFGGGTIVFKKGGAEVMVITSAYNGDMSKLDAAKYVAGKVIAAMR